MKERPILFSAPMVRAILEGRKTQTRRVVKNVPAWNHFGKDIMDWDLSGIHQIGYGEDDQLEGTDRWYLDVQTDVDDHSRTVIRCPYGQPGDRLWVRESFSGVHDYDVGHDGKPWPPSAWFQDEPIWYWADGNPSDGDWTRPRPSIHMPRWASRITLEVADVRVQRLWDISRDEALAEGIDTDGEWYTEGESLQSAGSPCSPERYAFASLWRAINGDASWEANPWVWVVSFQQVQA